MFWEVKVVAYGSGLREGGRTWKFDCVWILEFLIKGKVSVVKRRTARTGLNALVK